MVIEGIGVIRRIHTYEGTPTRITGEIIPLFTGHIGVPVDEHLFESLLGHTESSGIAHLQGKGHIMRHLGQTLTTPIGVPTKRTTLGVIRIQFRHAGHREILFPFHRSREIRQKTVHRIGKSKVIAFRQTHLTTGGQIVESGKWKVERRIIMMRQEAHQHRLIHMKSG